MRSKNILPLVVCVLLCFQAVAISVPRISHVQLTFEDSTWTKNASINLSPTSAKKAGFFTKLKGKILAAIFTQVPSGTGSKSAKKIVAWIALGLVGLGLVLLIATGGGAAAGYMLAAGFLAGIVALCMPRSASEKAAKKKSGSAAWIAIGVVVALVVGLAIALSGGHL